MTDVSAVVVLHDRYIVLNVDLGQLGVRRPGDLITAEIASVVPAQRAPAS